MWVESLVRAASLLERFAVARGSDAAYAAKLTIEVRQIRKANFKRDQANGKIRLREAHTCATDAELTQILTYATTCVFYKQTMQGSLRDIPDLAQSVDGNRVLKSLMKMIQHTRELSRFPVFRSRDSRGVLGKIGCALSCDSYKKIQSRVETYLRNFGEQVRKLLLHVCGYLRRECQTR